MPEIAADAEYATFINTFRCRPSDQDEVVAINVEIVERVASRSPGFISATVHRSTDGTRVINYLQWASSDHLAAMQRSEEFRAIAARFAGLIEFDPHECVVVYAAERAIGTVAEAEQEDIRRMYAAFNRRDIDAVLDRLAEDVHWANGMEGGHVEGRSAVRDYWTRQFTVIQANVEPEEISRADDGRVVVRVHQVVRAPDGKLLADERVHHLYRFRDGQITHFDIAERR